MVSIKSVLMLSMLVMATLANPTPDDQTKINAAQTILTLTNSLVGIKNLLSGNKQHFVIFFSVFKKWKYFMFLIFFTEFRNEHQADSHPGKGQSR